jgi:hypothetical protein
VRATGGKGIILSCYSQDRGHNVNIGKHPEREAPPKMQASTYISMLSMGVSENASLGT